MKTLNSSMVADNKDSNDCQRLDSLNQNESAIISKITCCGSLRRRMLDMGLIPGTKITMIRSAPLGSPIEYLLKGYCLSLRKEEASLVDVRKERGQ